MTGSWQVQTAKQRFSEVLRAAEAGEPQIITKHGTPVAVVLDIAEYRRGRTAQPSLAEFLRAGAEAVGVERDLPLPERLREADRTAALFEEST